MKLQSLRILLVASILAAAAISGGLVTGCGDTLASGDGGGSGHGLNDDDGYYGNNGGNNGGGDYSNSAGDYGNNGGAYGNNNFNEGDVAAPTDPDADPAITINGFTDTAEDNLATFSIDVDTASYTTMRASVSQWGSLPFEESVRVEEYINFFEYDYAAPEPGAEEPFAIHLEAAPSRFGEDNHHLLRVGIQGEAADPALRKPANLVFLVDVSGSMASPEKMGLVQHSLRTLLAELEGDDTIGIVTYAGNDQILLAPTPVAERATIEAAIDGLTAGGGTNGAAGIETAYILAEENLKANGVNRVVLCTDGDFNVGVRGTELVDTVVSWGDNGVFLSVLGVGRSFNDSFLEDLTNRANGNYAFIDTKREAERALGLKLMGTLQVIAKDVKIQVELNADVVESYRLIGYENRDIADEDFDNDEVDAGEIGAGHSVTAYLELILKDGATTEDALADVHVRYKEPTGDTSTPITRSITRGELRTSFDDASDGFRFGAAVSEYGEILRKSPFSAGADFEGVTEVAESAITLETPEHTEFLDLVEMARNLWGE